MVLLFQNRRGSESNLKLTNYSVAPDKVNGHISKLFSSNAIKLRLILNDFDSRDLSKGDDFLIQLRYRVDVDLSS